MGTAKDHSREYSKKNRYVYPDACRLRGVSIMILGTQGLGFWEQNSVLFSRQALQGKPGGRFGPRRRRSECREE